MVLPFIPDGTSICKFIFSWNELAPPNRQNYLELTPSTRIIFPAKLPCPLYRIPLNSKTQPQKIMPLHFHYIFPFPSKLYTRSLYSAPKKLAFPPNEPHISILNITSCWQMDLTFTRNRSRPITDLTHTFTDDLRRGESVTL